MKTVSLAWMVFVLSPSLMNGAGQEVSAWPKKSTYVTGYVSTLFLMASPVNIGFEHYTHPGWFHPGFSAGWTFLVLEGGAYAVTGPHATFSFFTGRRNHHFDMKAGFSYTPFMLYSHDQWNDYAWRFMPVATLGYRFQRPGGKSFFRAGLGVGGLGIGAGIRLNHK